MDVFLAFWAGFCALFVCCELPQGVCMKQKIINECKQFGALLRSVPAPLTVLFVLAVFAMNLLANKSISLHVEWLALDCGIIFSWVTFLVMDMITKHFGPKAATQLSLLAIAINVACCLLFKIAAVIPGMWGESFVEGLEQPINQALDNTFGGTWYVVLGSTIAFIASAIVNNTANWGIGKAFTGKKDGFGVYILRSYVSTAIGQFVDNFVFAAIVSHNFFGWTWVQCLTCAATGMVAELICQALFTPLGYKVCRRWQQRGVGAEYLQLLQEAQA